MAINYSVFEGIGFPKDSREDGKRKRDAEKAKRRSDEQKEKTIVRKRDGAQYCRLVPNCSEQGPFETAHIDDKGMGGDHGIRSTSDQMIRSCFYHHRGNWSLHSNDLRVEFLTPDGANGPIQVLGRMSTGEWYVIGREKSVCEWERD